MTHDPYTKQQIMFQRTPPRYHAVEGPYVAPPLTHWGDIFIGAAVIGGILGAILVWLA